jgi:hypothetical protein
VTVREYEARRARTRTAHPQAAAQPTRADHVLALQKTAGNRAVTRLLRQAGGTHLTPQAARAAAADVNKRYDEESIRALKFFANRPPDATFTESDATALAAVQQALGLAPTGKADDAFLNALLKQLGPTHAAHSLIIHLVADHADLDVSSAVSIVHDDSLTTAGELHSLGGGVAEIKLGTAAFADLRTLMAEIKKQLAKAPAASAVAAVPAAVLKDSKAQEDAIAFNKARLSDPRSVKIVEGVFGAKPSGKWTADAVRHIAGKQQAMGVKADGKVDKALMVYLSIELPAQGRHDAAIQLIIDYYDLDRAHAWDVVYVPTQPSGRGANANAQTLGIGNGVGGVVEIYPLGFSQMFEGLVHTIAHELGHTDQRTQGIASDQVREFLSKCIELESKGMPEEAFESEASIDDLIANRPPSEHGFVGDAGQLMEHWTAMTAAEKATYHDRYKQVRTLVLARIATGSAGQQAKLAPFVRRMQTADAGVP